MDELANQGEDPVFGNISDTACWVAELRALETERKDSCFQDPLARKLAGRRGQEMVQIIPDSQTVGWAITLRTCAIDELLMQTLSQDPTVDTVLNLAAGLDCRPYRLDLPPNLRWIEVDLPEIMAYKSHQLKGEASRCRLERIGLDLSDVEKRRTLFKKINSESKSVFVITEGLLMYLDEDTVVTLARDLMHPAFRWWIQDYCSDRMVAWMKFRFNRELNKLNAPLKFGIRGGPQYFERLGWKVAEYRSFDEEAQILGRQKALMRVWKTLSQFLPQKAQEYFRNTSGYLLLNR